MICAECKGAADLQTRASRGERLGMPTLNGTVEMKPAEMAQLVELGHKRCAGATQCACQHRTTVGR